MKEITLRLSDAQFNRLAKLAKLLDSTPETVAVVQTFGSIDSWGGSAKSYFEGWADELELYGKKGRAIRPGDKSATKFVADLKREIEKQNEPSRPLNVGSYTSDDPFADAWRIIAAAHTERRTLTDGELMEVSQISGPQLPYAAKAQLKEIEERQNLVLTIKILISMLPEEQFNRFKRLHRAEFEEVSHA